MSMASDLVAGIRAQITELTQVRAAIEGARNTIAEVLMDIQQWTDGTSDPRPGEALMRYQVGLEALETAEKEIKASEEALEAYIAHLLGSGGSSSTTAPQNPSPQPRDENSKEPSNPKFDPNKPGRDIVERVRKIGWPRTSEGKISARALFFDNDGNEVFNRTLKALPKGATYRALDLKDKYRSKDLTSSWHIEGGVAAHLRANRHIKSAALYINTPPCGRMPLDEAKCHANLRKILPQGTTLTVWIVRERGLPQKRVFEGTGEAIR